MNTYIILLRAVNVGGHNKIKMADLKTSLMKNKNLDKVITYIQSGNILLNSRLKTTETSKLVNQIIQEHFDLNIDVLAIPSDDWKNMAIKHNFEEKADELKQLLVTFLYNQIDEILIKTTLESLPEGEYCESNSIFLYSFYPNGYGNSKFNNNFIQKKLKTQCTTRNWKTIQTLTEKLEQNFG